MDRRKTVLRLSVIGLITNCVLVIIKLSVGAFWESKALFSDGIHSLADVLTTFSVIICVFAARYSEKCKKAEYYASLFLGTVLSITGVMLGFGGMRSLLCGEMRGKAYSMLPVLAAVLSMTAKWILYKYTMAEGKRIDSNAFIAEGYHNRADALCSLCTVIGLIGVKIGFVRAEAMACIFTSAMIIKTGIEVQKSAAVRIWSRQKK